jgi:hypothetical protein
MGQIRKAQQLLILLLWRSTLFRAAAHREASGKIESLQLKAMKNRERILKKAAGRK